MRTAALVAVDGLLRHVCASLSLPRVLYSCPSPTAESLPTRSLTARTGELPQLTTSRQGKKKNQGIPQNLQQEEGGPTTESSARYLSEISHASHGGINPLFLTLRRESEEAGVRERAQEAGKRRIERERASPPPRRCCCRSPPVLHPPPPLCSSNTTPEPPSGEIDGLLLTVHAAVRSCYSDRQESGAS